MRYMQELLEDITSMISRYYLVLLIPTHTFRGLPSAEGKHCSLGIAAEMRRIIKVYALGHSLIVSEQMCRMNDVIFLTKTCVWHELLTITMTPISNRYDSLEKRATLYTNIYKYYSF